MMLRPWLRTFLIFMAGAIFGVVLITLIAVLRPNGPDVVPTSAPGINRTI